MALPSDLNTRWFQAFTTDTSGSPALNVIITGGTITPDNITLPTTGVMRWAGRTQLTSSADGSLTLTPNNSSSTMSNIILGGSAGNSPQLTIGSNLVTLSTNNGTATVLGFSSFLIASIATFLTANGQIGYCSDCTIANPCAGGGSGAIAKRLNGVNVCN